MFGVRSLVMVEKVFLMRNDLAAMLSRRTDATTAAVDSLIYDLTGDKCLNEFRRYVEK